MCSGGPKCGGSSASRSEKIPLVSSEFALTVIEKTPRSIDLPSPDLSTYASPAPATMVASRVRWEHIVIHSRQADWCRDDHYLVCALRSSAHRTLAGETRPIGYVAPRYSRICRSPRRIAHVWFDRKRGRNAGVK